MSKAIINAAIELAEAGVPCFPCLPNKSPATEHGFKDATADLEQLKKIWGSSSMIGVPTGDIICLDIDAKHKSGLVEDFEACCSQLQLESLLLSLPKQTTPSGGGAHYLFRSPIEIRNKKLAKNKEKETIIETRGRGGYICVHPSKGYRFERLSLIEAPLLTEEEIESLFDVARAFSEVPVKEPKDPSVFSMPRKAASGDQPGDHYNERGDIVSLLRSNGWSSSNEVHWTRPGKKDGVSATLGKVEGKFYVFSSNAHPFEPEESYSPFGVYATLECGGDYSEATRRLREEGFGAEMTQEVDPEWAAAIESLVKREIEKKEMEWILKAPVADQAKEAIHEAAESCEIEEAIFSMAANTDENIEQMKKRLRDAVFVFPKIALRGDLTIINAQYNTGKTLLALWLLSKRDIQADERLFYINCDDSFNGQVEKMIITRDYKINTLIPGQRGFEAKHFAEICKAAIAKGEAHKFVFILDTLKKFVDTMDKKAAREFGIVARVFSQAGGTIVALAHTNKNKDGEGHSVAEGVGDFHSDFDAAYLLELTSPKDSDERTVDFINEKLRGPNSRKVSFAYDNSEGKSWHKRFQSVRELDGETAKEAARKTMAEELYQEDLPVVEYIKSQLTQHGSLPKRALIMNNLGVEGSGSRTRRERVLERYGPLNPDRERQLWGMKSNTTGGQTFFLHSEETRPSVGNLTEFKVS